MISINRYYLLPVSFLLISTILSAQIDTNALKKFKPARLREIYNDYVDAEQKNILKYDGKADNKLVISSNEERTTGSVVSLPS